MPATVSSQMAPTVTLQALTVILTAPDAVASILGAAAAWLPPGFPFTGTLTLSHADGLPAPGVQATMTLPLESGRAYLAGGQHRSLVYDPGSHAITWSGDVPPGGPTTLAFSSVISPGLATHGDLLIEAAVAYNGVTTSQTFTVSLVLPDVNASGAVTVADIQQIAARWGSLARTPPTTTHATI